MTGIDPICALQAAMEGRQGGDHGVRPPKTDIFVTATSNRDVITFEHMKTMKDRTIVCNIGPSTARSVMARRRLPLGEIQAPRWTHVIFLTEGACHPPGQSRLVNGLAQVTDFVMSSSFANQTIAQIELFTHSDFYENGKVYVLPKHLDETGHACT